MQNRIELISASDSGGCLDVIVLRGVIEGTAEDVDALTRACEARLGLQPEFWLTMAKMKS